VVVCSAKVLRKDHNNVELKSVRLTVYGVRGVAGVVALPPVEVGHNMLQEI